MSYTNGSGGALKYWKFWFAVIGGLLTIMLTGFATMSGMRRQNYEMFAKKETVEMMQTQFSRIETKVDKIYEILLRGK